MERVYICSPYGSSGILEDNILLAKAMILRALCHGYAPFASHLLYTQVLDDEKPKERELGKKAGEAFLKNCDVLWIAPRPIKGGMIEEIRLAFNLNINAIQITKEDLEFYVTKCLNELA